MTMTNKEGRQLKHSLKTEIDKSEIWIMLALSGKALQCDKESEATQTREVVSSHLKEIRANIQEKTEKYLEVIDEAINKIS